MGAGQRKAEDSSVQLANLFRYEELFLRVLSFLSPTDLASVQSVNRYWSRMTLDPQLWKRLYLSQYPHPHQSRLIYRDPKSNSRTAAPSGSSTPSSSLRPIARLPSRAFPPPSPSRSPSLRPEKAPAGRQTGTSGKRSRPEALDEGRNKNQHDEEALQDEVGYGVRNDGVDWKVMLRLGTNWSNGNATTQTTIALPPSPSPSVASVSLVDGEVSPTRSAPPYSEQHIALFPSFIFTSNPTSPLVHVHGSGPSSASSSVPLGIIPPPPGWSSPSRPDNVTAICADQSVAPPDDPSTSTGTDDRQTALPARVAIFYQSGGFVVVKVHLQDGHLSWSRESVRQPQSRPKSLKRRPTTYSPHQGDPVVLAILHYPALLACSADFHLSFYSLTTSRGPSSSASTTEPRHISTLHSDVSFHPAALSLFPASDDDTAGYTGGDQSFRAALTYCTPLYPSSWTIAVQEFNVDLAPTISNPFTDIGLAGTITRGECYHVGKDGVDDIDIWPRRVKPVVGVKGRAVGVGTDGRWCVLAGEDNQIQVYSLPTPTTTPSPSSTPPSQHASSATRVSSIVHSQTLLAHSSAVTSISLFSGRCVSGGRDGRVLVWELDDVDDAGEEEGRLGRTVGYVEVKRGGRREWKGPSGPVLHDDDDDEEEKECAEGAEDHSRGRRGLPHPASISTAARSLFLPRPPADKEMMDVPPAIRQLAFDEEKIVGLVRAEEDVFRPTKRVALGQSGKTGGGELLKVWSFG